MADLPPPPDPAAEPDAGPGAGLGAGPETAPGADGSGPESAGPPESPESSEPTELTLGEVVATARDIVLYAPIALVLDAPTLLPKLAEQGKEHMRNARVLGPHALRKIQNRLAATAETVGEQATGLLRQLGVTPEPAGGNRGHRGDRGDARSNAGVGGRPSPVAEPHRDGTGSSRPSPAPRDVASQNGRAPAAPAATPAPAAGELAIPDYDSLSALQVVDRLPGLTPDELEAVRTYEAAHRGRKTILNKAAQLQA